MDVHEQKAWVAEQLEEKLEEPEWKSYFLIEVKIGGRKITVYLDGDEAVNFNRCQTLSRWLEGRIEASGLFPEHYILEVSSPGVDRPLIDKRQYFKHEGRLLGVWDQEGTYREGFLVKVNGDGIILEEPPKKGKKEKNQDLEQFSMSFDEIDKSLVKVTI